MMDLECDIPGNIVTTAMLCSSCGNTFPNKKSYSGHVCPALTRSAESTRDTPDSDLSPRKDFSISGLLKQEEVKMEALEEKEEEDIMIISENIQPTPKPKKRPMQPPAPKHKHSNLYTSIYDQN